tara:strand:- start:423 stop:638 length:216 start_codon:yes stop_codon:yes gene_type:complete
MGKLKAANYPSNYDLFWNEVVAKIKDATHVEELEIIIAWAERESKTAGEMISHSCHIQSQCQELWNDYFTQ